MAGIVYPSYPAAVDPNGIIDAFNSGFDRSRKQKHEREFAEMAPRLLGGVDVGNPRAPGQIRGDVVSGPWGQEQAINGKPMSLASLGQRVPAPVGDYASQRVSQASGDAANPMNAYFAAIRSAESGGDDAARNPNSTATGRYQFTAPTWNDLARNNPQLGLTPEGRNDPEQQERAIRAFTGQNARSLSQAGLPVNPASLYAAHFLGAGGATKALSAPDDAPMAAIVGPEVVQANPFLADMSVADFRGWTSQKSGYAPQQQKGGAGQALNAMAGRGVPAQAADARGAFPPPPSDSVFDDEPFMRKALANPLTRDLAIGAAKARIAARQDASDPMKRLQLEKAQLELEQLRNPNAKPTDDMREFEFAKSQGFPGSFVEFQLAQKKAGATNVTTNVGEGDKFYENLDKKNAETFSALSEEGLRGRSKLAQIDRLEGLLSSAPQGAEGAFKQMLGEYGIKTDDMNNIQAAQALINELVPQQRQPGSGPMSDADLALFKQSLPRIINQPGGNQTIIDTMRGITSYQVKMGQIADAVADREMTPKRGREAIRALANPLEQFAKASKGNGAAQSPSGATRGAGGEAGRQRARNPKTGEVMELVNGQWVPTR